jgi:quinol monooxygenase YgiN
MSDYVILAVIRVRPGTGATFKEAVLVNAALSIRDEPACRAFDILQAPNDPDLFYAHEAFDNEAGFEAHKVTPHSMAFKAAVGDLMIEHVAHIGTKIS